MAVCPFCDEPLEYDDDVKGDIIDCPECGEELEVVSELPFEVASTEY